MVTVILVVFRPAMNPYLLFDQFRYGIWYGSGMLPSVEAAPGMIIISLYAPATDQPFIGGVRALLKRTPEQNAAFERCAGFLAEMIEKYSGEVEFPVLPADSKTSWDSLSNEQASERFDALMKGYAQSRGIAEALKAEDPMKWAGLINLAPLSPARMPL